MKRMMAMLLALLMMVSMLAACGDGAEDSTKTPASSSQDGTKDDGQATEPEGSEPEATQPEETEPKEMTLEESLAAEKDKLLEAIGGVTDLTGYSVKNGSIKYDDDSKNRGYIRYELSAGGGVEFTSDVVIGQTPVTLVKDTTIGDLIDMGWSCSVADEPVSSYIIAQTVCKDPQGKYAFVYALNDTDGELAVKDCVVGGFGVVMSEENIWYPREESAGFTMYGFNKRSSMTQVIAAIGRPQNIFITNYFNNRLYTHSKVYIQYIDPDDWTKAMEFTFEIRLGDSELVSMDYVAQ